MPTLMSLGPIISGSEAGGTKKVPLVTAMTTISLEFVSSVDLRTNFEAIASSSALRTDGDRISGDCDRI